MTREMFVRHRWETGEPELVNGQQRAKDWEKFSGSKKSQWGQAGTGITGGT